MHTRNSDDASDRHARPALGASRFAAGILAANALAVVVLASGLLAAGAGQAQTLSGAALVEALRDGGYVIAMRHAASPRSQPDAASASPGNDGLERQLDATGRDTASAMGAALERLGIPIGQIFSSPTFRAVETVRHLGLGAPQTVAGLDSRQRDDAWLRAKAAERPPAGTNALIVTHRPNLSGAFGDDAEGAADGEALILEPSEQGAVTVGRVRIEEWPALPGS